jgi:hypothetical protein
MNNMSFKKEYRQMGLTKFTGVIFGFGNSYQEWGPLIMLLDEEYQEPTRKKAVKWNAEDELHDDELPGKDIFCSKEGLWHV